MQRLLTIIATIGLLMPAGLFGQVLKAEKTEAGNGNQPTAPPPIVVGARYQSLRLKDPFLNPILQKKQADIRFKLDDEVEPPGNPPPGIAGMYIAQVMLLGISTADSKRTAVFRGTDKRAYFLQDGDRVFDGFIKNIGMDDVLMVRETRLRSGKILTQEITKRLRTP